MEKEKSVEIEDLQAKLSQMEKINSSQTALNQSEAQIWNKTMEEMKEASSRVVSKLEEDALAKDTIICNLEAENARFTKDLDKSKTDFQMLNAVSNILPQKVEELTKELNHANSTIEENKVIIDSMQTKYQELQHKMENQTLQNETEHKEHIEENENLKSLNKKLLEELQSVKDKSSKREEELIKRKQNDLEGLKKTQAIEISALQSIENELRTKLETESEKLNALQDEVVLLNDHLEKSKVESDVLRLQKEEVDGNIHHLVDTNECIGLKLALSEKSYLDAVMELNDLKTANESLITKNEDNKLQIEALENTLLKEQESLREVINSRSQIESKLVLLESEKTSLYESKESLLIEINALKHSNTNLVNQLQDAHDGKDSKNFGDYEALLSEHEILKNLSRKLENEKIQIENKLVEKINALAATEDKLSFTTDDNLALIGNFTKLESELKSMRESKDSLLAKYKELKKNTVEFEENLFAEQKALEETKNAFSDAQEKHVAFKRAYGSEMTLVKQKLNKAEENKEEMEETIRGLNDRLILQEKEQQARIDKDSAKDVLYAENTKLKAEIINFQDNLEKVTLEKEEEVRLFQTNIKSAQRKNDEIIEVLKQDLEKINQNMENEVASLTTRHEQELLKLKEENNSLFEQLKETKLNADAQNEQHNDHAIELQKEIQTFQSENNLKDHNNNDNSNEEEVGNNASFSFRQLRAELAAKVVKAENEGSKQSQDKQNLLGSPSREREQNLEHEKENNIDNEISEHRMKIKVLTNTETNVKNEMEILQRYLHEERMKNEEIQKIASTQIDENEELKDKIRSLEDQLKTLENSPSTTGETRPNNNITNLNLLLDTEKSKNEQLLQQLESKESEFKNSELMYNKLMHDFKISQSQAAESKRENDDILHLKQSLACLQNKLASADQRSKRRSNHDLTIDPTQTVSDDSMKPLGSAAAALIGSPANSSDLIIPHEYEVINKPPNLIDFIDAIASNNWIDVNLMNIAEIALRNHLGDAASSPNVIEDYLDVSYIQEFSSKKHFWYAKLTVGKNTWDPSIPTEHHVPFSYSLAGVRLGKIVYDNQESAIDALLFFILRSVDPTGKWIDGYLSENERSCLLKKIGAKRKVPWTALIRKGEKVYLSDIKEDKSESTEITKKSMLVRRSV